MPSNRDGEQFRKLFIGGISYDSTETSLREFFGQWGTITDCVVMRDPTSKRSRGFGFVTFEDSSSLDEAQNNRPHVIDNKEVETKRATPREEAGKPEARMSIKKVFVGGLSDAVEDADLQEYFSSYGNVNAVDIIKDKATDRKRGFAFVTFDDYDPVDKIVLEKNHSIKGKRCDIKKAMDKKEFANMQQRGGGSGGSSMGGGMGRGGGGRGGGRGGRGGGRFNSGGGSYGNNYNNGGGYNDNYNGGGGNNWGNNQGGWGGNQSGGNWGNNQGGGNFGGDGGYSSGNNWGASGGGGGNSYGGGNQGYSNSAGYSGGPMKGGNYANRGTGPYGGGYGNQGGGNYGGGY